MRQIVGIESVVKSSTISGAPDSEVYFAARRTDITGHHMPACVTLAFGNPTVTE